jgi:hypothetical protein
MVVVGEMLKSQRKNNNKITDRIKIVNASSYLTYTTNYPLERS